MPLQDRVDQILPLFVSRINVSETSCPSLLPALDFIFGLLLDLL